METFAMAEGANRGPGGECWCPNCRYVAMGNRAWPWRVKSRTLAVASCCWWVVPTTTSYQQRARVESHRAHASRFTELQMDDGCRYLMAIPWAAISVGGRKDSGQIYTDIYI